jgi:manganese-dependent inorganic pyrophosphatase
MGDDTAKMPENIRCAMLSCILSDTLEFRSPTTTDRDREVAQSLASELGISIPDYSAEMFAAKSDVSNFSDAELLRMDSKEYAVGGTKFRVSVLETTSPSTVLERKASLMDSMTAVASEDGVEQVLLFVIDILKEEATLLLPNDLSKTVAEKSFGAKIDGDTVVLPGVVSRKKQIIPSLAV